MKTTLIFLMLISVAFISCTKKQRQGWEKRAEKITGEQEKTAPVADTLNTNKFTLTDQNRRFLDLETTVVKKQPIADAIEVPAVTRPHPNHFVSIKAPIQGWIRELAVDPGSEVKENTVVAIIENPQNLGQRLQVRSPISGVVNKRPVNKNEWVENGAGLMEIIDYSALQGIMQLYPDEQSKVRIGQQVEFFRKGWSAKGRIQFISPTADPSTGSVEARADIANANRRIEANVPITARITIGEKTGLVVPNSALLHEEDHFIVFVRKGGQFEKRLVETGIRTNKMVEIVSGVTENEKVVTRGAYQLKNMAFSSAPTSEEEK
ncbi:MAG TPA: efflux RND transporter periplasmic adaptor subunit [Bacteroidetes bacterium]|nr:efflux RND transporter periplasmic adaptor subunit [Bacteroidota bacterium]